MINLHGKNVVLKSLEKQTPENNDYCLVVHIHGNASTGNYDQQNNSFAVDGESETWPAVRVAAWASWDEVSAIMGNS